MYYGLHKNLYKRKLVTEKFERPTINDYWPNYLGTRRMRALWTPELAQDLEAYHSIDAEAELEALLVSEEEKKGFCYKKVLLTEKYITPTFIVEVELANILSEEIAKSIDNEILNQLMNI